MKFNRTLQQFLIKALTESMDVHTMVKITQKLFKDYNTVGITAVCDGSSNDSNLKRYQKMLNDDQLTVRIAAQYYVNTIGQIEQVKENIRKVNPNAVIIEAASPIFVDKPELVKGKRVLVIEDGPTLTHGEMKYGAGVVAARRFGAKELVDPRPYLVGSMLETFEHYPEIGTLLPAMGYFDQQLKDLEDTINNTDCEVVVSATPIDITRLIKVNKPIVRVKYELEEVGFPKLKDVLKEKGFL